MRSQTVSFCSGAAGTLTSDPAPVFQDEVQPHCLSRFQACFGSTAGASFSIGAGMGAPCPRMNVMKRLNSRHEQRLYYLLALKSREGQGALALTIVLLILLNSFHTSQKLSRKGHLGSWRPLTVLYTRFVESSNSVIIRRDLMLWSQL